MVEETPPSRTSSNRLRHRRLIDVEGIGPTYASKLAGAGFHRMDDLLKFGAAEIAQKTSLSEKLVAVWRSMADLDRLETINNQYAELLARAGISNLEDLSRESPDALVKALLNYLATLKQPPTVQAVTEAIASEWIREARRFVAPSTPSGPSSSIPKPAPPSAPPSPTAAPSKPLAPTPTPRPPAPTPNVEPKTPSEETPPPKPAAPPTPAPASAPPPAPSAPAPASAKPATPAPPKPAPPPRPKTETEDVKKLQEKFSGILEHLEDTDPNIPTLLLKESHRLLEVARFLQQERHFEHLALITAVDYKQHIEVVYNFWSYSRNLPFELKVRLSLQGLKLPSLASLWETANWHEREEYDLMGVQFEGHPDLRRIFLPSGWKGHPLRKDYNLSQEQYVGLDPVTGEDLVYSERREGAW